MSDSRPSAAGARSLEALARLAASLPPDGVFLPDEPALQAFAEPLQRALQPAIAEVSGGAVRVALDGDLGAGKTTLARALLRRFGVEGPVKSPTYALFETYAVAGLRIAHADLYRIVDPAELDLIGFDDLLHEHALVLIEWAVQGGDRVPGPHVRVLLDTPPGGGRQLRLDVQPDASIF